MRIITYSDLHLEFGSGWTLPAETDGDVMILAGDIITLKDYGPLDRLLQAWKKPVPLCDREPRILREETDERRGRQIQDVAGAQPSACEVAVR